MWSRHVLKITLCLETVCLCGQCLDSDRATALCGIGYNLRAGGLRLSAPVGSLDWLDRGIGSSAHIPKRTDHSHNENLTEISGLFFSKSGNPAIAGRVAALYKWIGCIIATSISEVLLYFSLYYLCLRTVERYERDEKKEISKYLTKWLPVLMSSKVFYVMNLC